MFLSISVFLLVSCYPMGTFQGPDVLPEGRETVGLGISWMTTISFHSRILPVEQKQPFGLMAVYSFVEAYPTTQRWASSWSGVRILDWPFSVILSGKF